MQQIDTQIKEAERNKLLSEINKINYEKFKIELECKVLEKQHNSSWFKKKEFWSIFVGTLIAWTAVGFYISYSILPLSQRDIIAKEIENLTVKKENIRVGDSLQ